MNIGICLAILIAVTLFTPSLASGFGSGLLQDKNSYKKRAITPQETHTHDVIEDEVIEEKPCCDLDLVEKSTCTQGCTENWEQNEWTEDTNIDGQNVDIDTTTTEEEEEEEQEIVETLVRPKRTLKNINEDNIVSTNNAKNSCRKAKKVKQVLVEEVEEVGSVVEAVKSKEKDVKKSGSKKVKESSEKYGKMKEEKKVGKSAEKYGKSKEGKNKGGKSGEKSKEKKGGKSGEKNGKKTKKAKSEKEGKKSGNKSDKRKK